MYLLFTGKKVISKYIFLNHTCEEKELVHDALDAGILLEGTIIFKIFAKGNKQTGSHMSAHR